MYQAEIEKLENEIEKLNEKKKDIIQRWIKKEHPLKERKKVKVNGYSFTGKNMKVRSLYIYKDRQGWTWKATGPVLKKDGTESCNYGEWTRKIDQEKS